MIPALVFAAFCFAILLYIAYPRRLEVTRVVDGDSIEAIWRSRPIRVRLAGFDAPEYRQPAGKDARAALVRIASEHTIRMSCVNHDRYGRYLGVCFAGTTPVSWRMIVAGYGWPEGKIGFILSFIPKFAKRGLWAAENPVHPSFWRRINTSSHPAKV